MDVLDKCQTVIVQLPAKSVVYDWLYIVHDFYRPVHTYVSIMLCAVGAVCNFCNIVVLTRKQMRTPVNLILTAMACCDTVVLFSNLVYTTHYTFVAFANCHPRHWSYGWAMFLIAHAHLSLVGHSSSIWLSVMLALIRYLTLRRRGKMTGIQIDLRHSYMAIAAVILFVSLMNAPNFLTYKISELGLNETCVITDESVRNASAYVPDVSDLAMEADCLVFRMAFWISGTVFKVLPCLLLTLLVSLLTRILNEIKANRQRLLRGPSLEPASSFNAPSQEWAGSAASTFPSSNPPSNNNGMITVAVERETCKYSQVLSLAPPQPGSRLNSLKPSIASQTHPHHPHHAKNRTDRTTRMLLAIVCVFLITELPQGIMAVLSGMFSEEFRRYIYNNLGDILDLLSLCGACTSFIIYCSMSGQFRNEFRRVFLPHRLKCWLRGAAGANCQQQHLTSHTLLAGRDSNSNVHHNNNHAQQPHQQQRSYGLCGDRASFSTTTEPYNPTIQNHSNQSKPSKNPNPKASESMSKGSSRPNSNPSQYQPLPTIQIQLMNNSVDGSPMAMEPPNGLNSPKSQPISPCSNQTTSTGSSSAVEDVEHNNNESSRPNGFTLGLFDVKPKECSNSSSSSFTSVAELMPVTSEGEEETNSYGDEDSIPMIPLNDFHRRNNSNHSQKHCNGGAARGNGDLNGKNSVTTRVNF